MSLRKLYLLVYFFVMLCHSVCSPPPVFSWTLIPLLSLTLPVFFNCVRGLRMAQGIPNEVLMNTTLVKDLADVAKDAALLQGVLMRIQEKPNSSEVRI